MKFGKKNLISLLLAFCMVFIFAVPAFAASPLDQYTHMQHKFQNVINPEYCASSNGKWAHGGKCSGSGSYLGDDKYLTGLPIIKNGVLVGWLNIGPAKHRPENYYKSKSNDYYTTLIDRGVSEDHVTWFIFETVIGGGSGFLKKTAEKVIKNAVKRKAGTVWEFIKGTQKVIKGTIIPKSFELTTRNAGKVWVHPNATKHMEEYVKKYINHSHIINQQALLTSFKSAVDYSTRKGIVYDKMIYVGGWELKFSKKAGDVLPVIKHALFK